MDDRELLVRLCGVVNEALPLAVERLRSGSVPIRDQRWFWMAFTSLQEWLVEHEPEFDELMNQYLNGPDEVLEYDFDDFAAALGERVTDAPEPERG